MIPYGRQLISEEDIQAVVDVLRSDFLTQGPAVAQFEKAICNYTNSSHAVAVNSGTSALHLACRALNLGPGDILWTSPITFVASANCALYCGAEVDFVDVDPKTYNISIKALTQKLELAKQRGCLPKVIIPVHMCGQSCDMQAIAKLSKQYGFYVIEDACHAIGGRYQGELIGGCQYSDITVFSFHPVKSMTTGEGGIAATNRKELAEKMTLLRSHGITRDAGKMIGETDGPWDYQQLDLGYNYRLTDFQAALGMSQLQRLNAFIEKRHKVASRYDSLLSDLPLVLPWRDSECYSAFHLYVIRLKLNKITRTHRQVFESLRESGVGVNLHYIPVYRQPHYQSDAYSIEDYPEAESYYSEAISLPIFPDLSEDDQHHIKKSLGTALL